MIAPTPYPTSGNAIPNTWDCQTDSVDATLQHCAVTGWQQTSPQPTVTETSTSTGTPTPYASGFNASDVSYGNWSSSWGTYLGGLIFAAAFCIILSGMIIGMARKALR